MESSILNKLYSQKDKSFQDLQREQMNPKDMQGIRLSRFWQKGDTITSVSVKKTKNFFIQLFNPYTYSQENLDKISFEIQKYKGYYVVLAFMIFSGFTIFAPTMFTKYINLKNHYYLTKVAKREFFERKFVLQNKRISLVDIKKDIESRTYR